MLWSLPSLPETAPPNPQSPHDGRKHGQENDIEPRDDTDIRAFDMNALAGAYVSEVSSLPAYPCMVYLSHAESRVFYVSHYDGDTERFTDPSALYGHISRAHGDLAEQLRAAEARGQEFDLDAHSICFCAQLTERLHVGEK